MRATVHLLTVLVTILATSAATQFGPKYQGKLIQGVGKDTICVIGGDVHCSNACYDSGYLTGNCINDECHCASSFAGLSLRQREGALKMAAKDATCLVGGEVHCSNLCYDLGYLTGKCVEGDCYCGDGMKVVGSWPDALCGHSAGTRSTVCDTTCRFGPLRATTGHCVGHLCSCLQRHH